MLELTEVGLLSRRCVGGSSGVGILEAEELLEEVQCVLINMQPERQQLRLQRKNEHVRL